MEVGWGLQENCRTIDFQLSLNSFQFFQNLGKISMEIAGVVAKEAVQLLRPILQGDIIIIIREMNFS